MKRSHLPLSVLLAFAVPAFAADRADIDKTTAALATYTTAQPGTAPADLARLTREVATDDALRPYLESKLVTLLESDPSTWEARLKACQALWRIGSPNSLAVLERMLADEKDSHLACYAIGRQPGAPAGQTLARGLKLAKGRAAVNILNVLGSRAEPESAAVMAERTRDPDAAVSEAALAALAKLGTPDAYQAINQARNLLPAERRRPAELAMIELAENMAKRGDVGGATKIFEWGMKQDDPAIRRGALAGIISLGGPEGLAVAADALRGRDPVLAGTAIAAMVCQPDLAYLRQPGPARDGLSADLQATLLDALAVRVRSSEERSLGHGYATRAAASDQPAVQAAAARLLGRVGNAADVNSLALSLAKGVETQNKELEQSAFTALAALPADPATDQAIAGLFRARPPLARTAARVLADRRATAAIPALFDQARAADGASAKAAIDALGTIGGQEHLAPVLTLARTATDEDLRRATEQAAAAIALRNPDAPNRAAPVLAALRDEKGPVARAALLRILGTVGGPAALDQLTQSLADADAAVRDAALRSLAASADPTATNALLTVAKSADPTDPRRAIALRGALRQLADAAASAKPGTPASPALVAHFRAAADLARSADEKRLLLSGVTNLRDPAASEIVKRYLTDPEVAPEAKLAADKLKTRSK